MYYDDEPMTAHPYGVRVKSHENSCYEIKEEYLCPNWYMNLKSGKLKVEMPPCPLCIKIVNGVEYNS